MDNFLTCCCGFSFSFLAIYFTLVGFFIFLTMLSVIYVFFTNCAQYAVKIHTQKSSNADGVLSPRQPIFIVSLLPPSIRAEICGTPVWIFGSKQQMLRISIFYIYMKQNAIENQFCLGTGQTTRGESAHTAVQDQVLH